MRFPCLRLRAGTVRSNLTKQSRTHCHHCRASCRKVGNSGRVYASHGQQVRPSSYLARLHTLARRSERNRYQARLFISRKCGSCVTTCRVSGACGAVLQASAKGRARSQTFRSAPLFAICHALCGSDASGHRLRHSMRPLIICGWQSGRPQVVNCFPGCTPQRPPAIAPPLGLPGRTHRTALRLEC